jgi:hypothetical protein
VIYLLAKTESGGWSPGIGDPTFFGWLAVVGYFAAAYLAYRAGKFERRLQPRSSEMALGWARMGREAMEAVRGVMKNPAGILNYGSAESGPLLPTFWFGLCGVLVMLGVNKQLDLQTCFTQIGRDMAHSEGWYERRRIVQFIFVVVIFLMGVVILAAAYWYIRGAWQRYRIAFFGIIYIVCFVIIRAASFHHIDIFLQSTLGGIYFNHILELGGIIFTGFAAWKAARELPRPRVRAFEKTVRIR